MPNCGFLQIGEKKRGTRPDRRGFFCPGCGMKKGPRDEIKVEIKTFLSIKLHLCLHFVFFLSFVFFFFFFYGQNIPRFEILNLIFAFLPFSRFTSFSIHSHYWGFISATSIFFFLLFSPLLCNCFSPRTHHTSFFRFFAALFLRPPKNGTAKKTFSQISSMKLYTCE